MRFSTSSASALLAVLATTAQSHMVLYHPPPMGSPDNSPLNGAGKGASNYPCKLTSGGDASGPRTQMPIGGNFTVQFKGGATHGGGSCQFALTKDLKPTKNSEFKVIHSVEGGCPARGTAGNMGENAGAIDPNQYTFTLPPDLAGGDYTFAWTWFNKVGNREMYMNCAAVSLAGGGGKKKRDIEPRGAGLDKLPDLLLANIPDVKCTTPDSTNIKFQEPGKSVEVNAGPFGSVTGNAAQCYAPPGKPHTAGASSGGGAPAPAYPQAKAPTPAPAPTAPAAPSSMVTVTSTSYSGGAATQAAAAPASPSPGGSSGYTPAGGSGSCAGGAQPCQGPGSVVCMDGGKFGLCDQTGCAIPQPLAAGTTCSNGKIARRDAGRLYGHKHHEHKH